MPLTPQQIEDYFKTQSSSATPLSPAQYEASITSANLVPIPQINFPPKPIPTPITSAGGQAVIDANAKALATTPSGATVDTTTGALVTPPLTAPTDTSTSGGLDALFSKYFGAQKAPESSVDLYTQTYGITPEQARIKQETAQAEANLKAQAVKTAQSKLSAVNARLAGITAEAQAIPIQAQQDATGRGITAGGLAPITTAKLRENALKAIPLQAEALGAQAEVASATGDLQLSQDILQQAQGHLDQLFQIRVQDSVNANNFRNKQLDAIYDFATKKEKERIDAEKIQNTQNLQIKNDERNFAQTLAQNAIQNGQGVLGAKIAAIDPNIPNYREEVARLGGQIIPRMTSGGTGGGVNGKLTVDASSPDYLNNLFNSNIGGKKPTQVETLRPIQKTLSVASQLGELSSLIKNTKTDPILGALRSMNPYDFDVRAIQATLQATVPNLARGVYGEVGVLTDQDIKNYIQTLPNIKGTKAQNDFVLGMTLRSLQNGLLGQLEVLQGAGYDISGFRNSYDKLVNQSNKIEQTLGISKAVEIAPEKIGVFDSVVSQPAQGGYFSNLWKAITGK